MGTEAQLRSQPSRPVALARGLAARTVLPRAQAATWAWAGNPLARLG
jgi:hypothetical protein